MAPRPDILFRANPAERLLQPEGKASARSRYVAPLGACLIYALLLTPLIIDDLFHHDELIAPEEIPVEIVVEPQQTPPDPPQAQPEPQQQTKPLDEKPAFDAPRAANNDKTDTEADADPAKSPPAPEATKPPSPNPDSPKPAEAAKDSQADQNEQSAAASTPETAPDSSPQGEMSPEKPAQPEKHAEAETQPDSNAAADQARFPTFDSVPDIDFGALAKQAPIAGGKAKATYLSIVYGMIMARVHFPSTPRPAGVSRLEGTIVFSVDSMGGLIQRTIIHPSGSHALDVAAYDAVGRAAPFPHPPNGAPIGMRFTYGAN